jgi:hypothetical protein
MSAAARIRVAPRSTGGHCLHDFRTPSADFKAFRISSAVAQTSDPTIDSFAGFTIGNDSRGPLGKKFPATIGLHSRSSLIFIVIRSLRLLQVFSNPRAYWPLFAA